MGKIVPMDAFLRAMTVVISTCLSRVNAATVAQVYLALGRDWQPSRFQVTIILA